MDILPVSSSKKGLYEDEIKRGGYFPMQKYLNFPKLLLHTISIVDYQWVTRTICRSCDKIGISVTNSVTKQSPGIARIETRTSISRVKGEKRLFRGPRKSVTIWWLIHPWKLAFFNLNHSKLERLFRPSEPSILFSIINSVDRCLVWLVYLIHQSDRTSRLSFFFNPKLL